MLTDTEFLAYIGPETMLPLMSILAAICGLFMVFWRFVVNTSARLWSFMFRRKSKRSAVRSAGPKQVEKT